MPKIADLLHLLFSDSVYQTTGCCLHEPLDPLLSVILAALFSALPCLFSMAVHLLHFVVPYASHDISLGGMLTAIAPTKHTFHRCFCEAGHVFLCSMLMQIFWCHQHIFLPHNQLPVVSHLWTGWTLRPTKVTHSPSGVGDHHQNNLQTFRNFVKIKQNSENLFRVIVLSYWAWNRHWMLCIITRIWSWLFPKTTVLLTCIEWMFRYVLSPAISSPFRYSNCFFSSF